ncbi:hypothetical protein [uncultured Thiodictyon sp.]|uniref:hypothetical protein n=1 Tax=uncultured Thiodictyon sp. TaxID=1846217 RepID=UPI0025EAEF24|nr:hypothetical protein [uncultured Thiodictyon sp.]
MAIQKKREAPAAVNPVRKGGVRYEALHWGKERGFGQNGGYIVAVDEQTGAELWHLKVYDVRYDDDREGDKQDVFITRLSIGWFDPRLRVDNERGERFLIDLATREILKQ